MSIASVKRDLLNSLKDREFREAFTLENVYTNICFQVRALREQRDKSQKELGRLTKPKMAQERISILEDPNSTTKPTITTLLRLADAFDVGLEVRFVPFSKVLEQSTHTDMKDLQVESFSEELPSLEKNIESEPAFENETLSTVTSGKFIEPPIQSSVPLTAYIFTTAAITPMEVVYYNDLYKPLGQLYEPIGQPKIEWRTVTPTPIVRIQFDDVKSSSSFNLWEKIEPQRAATFIERENYA